MSAPDAVVRPPSIGSMLRVILDLVKIRLNTLAVFAVAAGWWVTTGTAQPVGRFVAAMAGSLLLSLTVMPVLASLAFRKGIVERETRLISFLRRIYTPTLAWAYRFRGLVAAGALLAVVGAGTLFLSLGGEFLPTLDEGDVVVQTLRLQSSSMTHSIEAGLEVLVAALELLSLVPEGVDVLVLDGPSEDRSLREISSWGRFPT